MTVENENRTGVLISEQEKDSDNFSFVNMSFKYEIFVDF